MVTSTAANSEKEEIRLAVGMGWRGGVLEPLWREQASSPERMSGCSPKVQKAAYLGLKRQAGQEPGSVGASETGMV